MALPTAIAGLLGTLAGTVVGGLISLAAVEQTIRAEEASNLRANRQEAYSVFLADVSRHAQLIALGLATDERIDSTERAELVESGLGLTRSYNAALLVASEAVSKTLNDLEKAADDYEMVALREEQGDIDDLSKRVTEAYNAVLVAARDDLGAGG